MTARSARSPARGAMYALTAAALFGFNGSVAKVVIEAGLTPAQVTVMRSAATVILAGGCLVVTGRAHFRISGREVAGFALLGIAGLAMLQWLYAAAISLLPVGVALLIEYTAVIMVAVFAWLVFKERVHPRLWLAIGAVLVGLSIVAQVWDSHLRPLGVLAACGAAVSYTFYFLAGERRVAARPPLAVAFWAALFATAFWGLFSAWWRIDPGLLGSTVSLTGSLAEVHVPVWVPLLWVVTLGAFAPFILSFSALKHLNATAVGILASSEVLFAFAVAWVWLGEKLTAIQVAGAALVLVGVIVAQTARERRADRPTPESPTEVP